ncbi:MAG TPA: lipocalin-like domain-containing protein [Myxococcales bacterium]|jgi:hypothetical protein|nr:lipocalin-like domain-containing protein [Myxococcales bacterium]
MKTIGKVVVTAAFSFAAAALAADNQKNGSLAKQVAGAWTLTSLVLDQDGKKSEPYGPGAKGITIFSNGRATVVITRAELPKFASNNRTMGTPEENKAVVAGSIAYFGAYEVDGDKTLHVHVEASTFPNWIGTDQQRKLELSGDEMKFINKAPSMGQGVVTATWKRVKESRTTAER